MAWIYYREVCPTAQTAVGKPGRIRVILALATRSRNMGFSRIDLKLTNLFTKSTIGVSALVDPVAQRFVVNPAHPNRPVSIAKGMRTVP